MAVAFLCSVDEVLAFLFNLPHDFRYPLETSEAFPAFDLVFFGDGCLKIRGDNAFYADRAGRHLPRFAQRRQDIVEVEGAQLIACHEHEIAVFVGNRDPKPVGVRIGSHDDIGLFLFPRESMAILSAAGSSGLG